MWGARRDSRGVASLVRASCSGASTVSPPHSQAELGAFNNLTRIAKALERIADALEAVEVAEVEGFSDRAVLTVKVGADAAAE